MKSSRKTTIIAIHCMVLYALLFAHALIPHDHFSHDGDGVLCCELINHDAEDEDHQHLPSHGAEQLSDIYVLQQATDSAPAAFFSLEAVIIEPEESEPLYAALLPGHHDSGPPDIPDCIASPKGLRAPPAA